MYGKIFSSLYNGSMIGAGPVVFSLWPYCIATADPTTHTVSLNPKLLGMVIGCDPEAIKEAIGFLMAPDPDSRNKDHDGARLINVTGHDYFVVSHEVYRGIKTKLDRNEYMRQYMAEKRAKLKANKANKVLTVLTPDSDSDSDSVSGNDSKKGKRKPKKQTDITDRIAGTCLDCDEFRGAWSIWVTHRKEKKSALTESTIKMQINKLEKIGRDDAIKMIEHTVWKGWTGLRAPDPEDEPRPATITPQPKKEWTPEELAESDRIMNLTLKNQGL